MSRRYDEIVARVAGRVLQFPPKPSRGPTLSIGGRKYALSTLWPGGLGDAAEEMDEQNPGEARVIRGPTQDPWKYLWAYDTDRQMVYMWRVSDGDEKVIGPARSMTNDILQLDKRGQLNRVTRQELSEIEREMSRRADRALKDLQDWIDETKTDGQRRVDEVVQATFDDEVLPRLLKQFREIDLGVVPIGFKPEPRDPRPLDRQMKTHVFTALTQRYFNLPYLEGKVFGAGIVVDDFDNQAVQWAHGEVIDRFVDAHFR